jgi:hypothetical protein
MAARVVEGFQVNGMGIFESLKIEVAIFYKCTNITPDPRENK